MTTSALMVSPEKIRHHERMPKSASDHAASCQSRKILCTYVAPGQPIPENGFWFDMCFTRTPFSFEHCHRVPSVANMLKRLGLLGMAWLHPPLSLPTRVADELLLSRGPVMEGSDAARMTERHKRKEAMPSAEIEVGASPRLTVVQRPRGGCTRQIKVLELCCGCGGLSYLQQVRPPQAAGPSLSPSPPLPAPGQTVAFTGDSSPSECDKTESSDEASIPPPEGGAEVKCCWAVDNWLDAAASYKINHPDTHVGTVRQ